MTRRQRLGSDAGLTLLELAVAVLILSLASLAALRAADQARLSIGGAQERTLAQLAADNRAEILGLPGAGALPDRVRLGGRDILLEVTRLPTAGGLIEATVTARIPGGAGAQAVAYLLPGLP
ncbi:prepilin-type N-terminal cleavage/methylation domain-containing protein [Jannaschia seohaensis]|nr:prepilin-type N-terminal cleavage/methylation domain-containing protein [Jannaschia seohaensis]